MTDGFWKRVAGSLVVLMALVFGYLWVTIWFIPRMNAGLNAVSYINRCIEAGRCPTVPSLTPLPAPVAPVEGKKP